MKLLLSLIGLSLIITSYGQEEHSGKPCVASAELRSLLKKSLIPELYVFGGYEDSFSSSLLKPGTANKATLADYKKMDDEEKTKYEKWSCQYGARNVSDGNPKTAWVEGVAGPGTGEVLLITEQLNPSKKVEIWNGYGANESLFQVNNRVKTIGVHIVKAMPDIAGQFGTVYRNLTVVASGTVTLKDVNGFQLLPLPSFKRDTFHRDDNDWDYAYWLLLEIVDVYPGTKYQDTCISEIRNAH